jgi:ABC-type branched-subunit amino acid transport system ATPase component
MNERSGLMNNSHERALIQVSGLTKYFGGLPALEKVDFAAARGMVTALIGPNGAGKTTLINCLTGVLTPDQGEILFDGHNLAGLPAHEITRLGISRTFQNLRLFPRLSVLDNVLCGLTVQAGSSMLSALLRTPSLRHRERRLRLPWTPSVWRTRPISRRAPSPTATRSGWRWPGPLSQAPC